MSDACRAYALDLSIWKKLGWADKIAETEAHIEGLHPFPVTMLFTNEAERPSFH